MRIARLQIENFRGIRATTLFPGTHNVYLGPNNIGKTAVLEALNFLLNPELGTRGSTIDKNDFHCRHYRLSRTGPDLEVDRVSSEEYHGAVDGDPVQPTGEGTSTPTGHSAREAEGSSTEHTDDEQVAGRIETDAGEISRIANGAQPCIRIEAVLTDLSADDFAAFASVLVPWHSDQRQVVEASDEGQDPFANAESAIRVCFEAWYDDEEDDFEWRTFFRTDPQLSRDTCPRFTRNHKRRIGFLIYRDFRALHRPITLESFALFSRLLASRDATPKHFESVLDELAGAVSPLFAEPDFKSAVNEYREELLRYLPLANTGDGSLSFEATDRTREQVKAAAQLYVSDQISLPLQKMGAGTRSLVYCLTNNLTYKSNRRRLVL